MATKNTAQTAGQKAAATKAANKAAATAAEAKDKPKAAPASKAPVNAKATKAVKTTPPKAKAATVTEAPADEADGADEDAPGGGSIGRKELAQAIHADLKANGFGAPEKLVVQMVQSFEKAVSNAISAGTDVVLPGFGKFKTTLRAAGERRNPRSGESMTVAASWAVGFKPGKALKDAANTRPAS